MKLTRKMKDCKFYDIMPLIVINLGMTLSIICFYIGYFYRIKNNSIHKRINIVGVILNLSTAIYLLAHKYLLNGIEAAGIFPTVPILYINIHRFFAGVSLVIMLMMAITGIAKQKEIHKKIHYFFLPLYTIVYISGLFIFESR